MLKLVPPEVWVFDVEWVPDADSGRRVYNLSSTFDDTAVLNHMWTEGGATEKNARPYLKTALCRVVSISALVRKRAEDGQVSLRLRSLPSLDAPVANEADILDKFLTALGRAKPQLVGFNSVSADIPILIQRALAHSLHLPEFCHRPAKPWEGVDYFARGSDFNIDLKEVTGGWGKSTPSLHELATVCRIPGKLGTDGADVIDLWQAGDVRRIVQYNECDVLTTYLIWLRTAFMAGHLDHAAFAEEESQLSKLLTSQAANPANSHYGEYLQAWQLLRGSESLGVKIAATS